MQSVRALFGQVGTRVIMVFRHNPAHSVFRGGENQSSNTGCPAIGTKEPPSTAITVIPPGNYLSLQDLRRSCKLWKSLWNCGNHHEIPIRKLKFLGLPFTIRCL